MNSVWGLEINLLTCVIVREDELNFRHNVRSRSHISVETDR